MQARNPFAQDGKKILDTPARPKIQNGSLEQKHKLNAINQFYFTGRRKEGK